MNASQLVTRLLRFPRGGSPRPRLLVFLALGLLGLYLITSVAASAILLPGFGKVEADDTTEQVLRAREALSATIQVVSNAASDWANWTDTYEFIAGATPQFVADNVDLPGTFVNVKVDVMLFVHRSGRRVLTRVFDQDAKRFVPPSKALIELVAPPSILLRHATLESQINGLVLLPEGPLLVGSRPILTSEMTGPIRGSLIFGRYLDSRLVQELREQVHLDLLFMRAKARDLPSDFEGARTALLQGTTVVVRPLSRDKVAGYTLIPDIGGNPALILRVTVPRKIFSHGRTTSRSFIIALVGFGLLLGLFLTSLLDRLIRARFARERVEERHHAVVEQTSDGILLLQCADWQVLESNRACQEMLGKDEATFRDHRLSEISPALQQIAERVSCGDADSRTVSELSWVQGDGVEADYEVTADSIVSDDQHLIVLALRDVTARRAAERALRASEERYALAAQGANDGLWDWHLKTDQIYFSPRWKTMLGLADDEVGTEQKAWLDRAHPDDRSRLAQTLVQHIEGDSPQFECEHRMLHKDGAYRWMLSRGIALRDATGVAYRFAGSMSDITDRKLAEERLLHDALHDSLTALPNRALFIDRLGQAILRAKRSPGFKFAVLFLDLDRFKVVNDSLGHLAGDALLTHASRRLMEALRAEDTVARLGGDEFAVLLEDVKGPDFVAGIVTRIHALLRSPFDIDGNEVYVTASIGSVVACEEHRQPQDLLRDADTALYKAKARGRDRHVTFDPSMHAEATALLQLETELRRAVELHELVLHYQPVIAFSDGVICGFEALIRWQHPRRGLLSPGTFISLAEETGLIVPIGSWVLQEACAQIRTLAGEFPGDPPLWISANVAAKQFARPELVDEVANLVEANGIAPRALKLEITESAVMEDLEKATGMIRRLQALGAQIALDDFGTGYSSLAILRRLPIDIVKIDRSFIGTIRDAGTDPAFVRTIVSLAHGLGMGVVAEGVETEVQAVQLKALGCEYGQGYVFSKPLSAGQVAHLLTAGRRHSRTLLSPAAVGEVASATATAGLAPAAGAGI